MADGIFFTRVAEQVDAQDLKSCFPKRKYGFDSRLGYHYVETAAPVDSRFLFPVISMLKMKRAVEFGTILAPSLLLILFYERTVFVAPQIPGKLAKAKITYEPICL